MQRHRMTALMACFVLVILTGCKDQAPPVAAPAAAPVVVAEGPASHAASPTPIAEETILIRKHEKPGEWRAHHRITPDTLVTWKANEPFYIQFDSDNDPCDQSQGPTHAHIYSSKQTGSVHTAGCKVTNTKKGIPFGYQFFHGAPPKNPISIERVTPCHGCQLEDDPDS